MDDTLTILLTIQSLDDKIKSAQVDLEGIPDKISNSEKEIEKEISNLQVRKNRIQEIKKIYKTKEGDLADNENKINKLNSQTFSVKTNEEYRAIINEVDYLKKENKKTEDEMIGLLEEEEKLKVTIDEFEKETKDIIDKRRTEIDSLKKKREELIEKQKQDQISFGDNFNKLSDDIKAIYKRISNVRDRAICLISNNTCTGCYANLTPQFMNELKKKNKLRLCDNCGRILIYVASSK